MLDRPTIEAALRTGGWSSTDDVLRASATSLPDEGERWRFVSMAECARVLGSGVEGRDAAAQIRELVRLADGHLEIPTSMLQSASGLPWRDAALSCVAETEGRSVLELSDGFPIFDAVPDLRWAVKMEARSRRNTRPEAASAFLHHFADCDAKVFPSMFLLNVHVGNELAYLVHAQGLTYLVDGQTNVAGSQRSGACIDRRRGEDGRERRAVEAQPGAGCG